MPPTLAQAWQNYKNSVLDEDTPPAVLLQAEMSFYAGAACVLQSIQQLAGVRGAPPDLKAMILWQMHADKDIQDHLKKIQTLAAAHGN